MRSHQPDPATVDSEPDGRIRTSCVYPKRAECTSGPGRDAIRAGARQLLRDLPDGRGLPTTRAAFCTCSTATTSPLCGPTSPRISAAIYNRLEVGSSVRSTRNLRRTGCSIPCTPNARWEPPRRRTHSPDSPADVTHHNIITEWRATNPAASTFEGTRRELLRVAHVVQNLTHPFGHVEFNPTAKPGTPDYGLLYTSGSDLGFSNGGGPHANNPGQTQRLDSVIGAILRIDPRSPSVSGGTKGLGDYTIPMANKLAADGDPKTLGEIYAYGFRNAHRLSWDLTDGTMFANDIGMNHIEEVNIVRNGENYGWMKREGYWENGMTRPGGALNQLFPLPADVLEGRQKDEFTYPVAIYDHNEGQAIAVGCVLQGRSCASEASTCSAISSAGVFSQPTLPR